MIKLFSIFFLILLPGIFIYSYAEDPGKLEEEIGQLLKDKYGYGSTTTLIGINNPVSDEVTDEQYIKGLKKLKIALQKTQNIRDFKNIGYIYISSRETIDTYKGITGNTNLYFPIDKPPEAWIELLSSDPENEPEYQKYIREQKEIVEEKLKEQFGEWYNFHKAGKKILCEHQESFQDTEKIKEIVSKLTGKSVANVRYDDSYGKKLYIRFSNPPPARIEIAVFTEERGSYVLIDNKKAGAYFNFNKLAISLFTVGCNLREARTWKYDSEGNLWRRRWLDKNGDIEKTVFVNRRVMSLTEIYCLHNHPNKSFEEILDVANDMDRVLVTILDSGVDYNHPELAYKIARPDETSLKTIKNQLAKLNLERDAIQEKFDQRGKIGKFFHRKAYEAKMASINEDIKETEKKLAEEEKMSAVGWDFEENDAQPYDYAEDIYSTVAGYDHGTHVAGIAAQGSDEIAILPIRYPKSDKEWFYEAIQYVHARGSRIVNVSIGSDDKEDWEEFGKAVEDHPDMLFVVAAGNEERDIDIEPSYPPSFDHSNILVVAAIDENGELADFSNYGKSSVDIAAPGEDILSLEPEGSTGEKSGTSMAAPHVTRVAAKIKAINPQLTPRQIIAIIRDSVEKTPELQMKLKYGGVVDEDRALELARTGLN